VKPSEEAEPFRTGEALLFQALPIICFFAILLVVGLLFHRHDDLLVQACATGGGIALASVAQIVLQNRRKARSGSAAKPALTALVREAEAVVGAPIEREVRMEEGPLPDGATVWYRTVWIDGLVAERLPRAELKALLVYALASSISPRAKFVGWGVALLGLPLFVLGFLADSGTEGAIAWSIPYVGFVAAYVGVALVTCRRFDSLERTFDALGDAVTLEDAVARLEQLNQSRGDIEEDGRPNPKDALNKTEKIRKRAAELGYRHRRDPLVADTSPSSEEENDHSPVAQRP
jgi:hypothetical protein